MALLLDTRDVVPEARRDAVRDAYALAELPRRVDLLSQEAVDTTRIEGWMFGSLKLFAPESPGLSVIRDSPSGLDPMIALCIQHSGTGRSTEEHRQQLLMPGELLMVDPTARNEFLVSGATIAIEVPFDEIGVTVEVARKASTRLPASPLFPLVSHHLLELRADADLIALSAKAPDVGLATIQLVRALIMSAALDERSARPPLADAVAPRIFAYVRRHLTEADLTPVTIARAHNISVRHLYKLCDAAGVRLVEWIIAERLEGARRELMTSGGASGTIAHVSHKWGFKDPSHFSTRFRNAYGMSPRDLQRQSRGQQRDRPRGHRSGGF
jgi:AraC-like DNA-binding protein